MEWHSFKAGDRVEMTTEGIEQGLDVSRGRRITTGVIAATHPLLHNMVKVKRDGLKTSVIYHVKFWRAARTEEGRFSLDESSQATHESKTSTLAPDSDTAR